MFNIILIILPLFLFFVVQVGINKEVPLALTVVAIAVFALYQSNNILGEVSLFVIGLLFGLIIEVGLGLVLRTQHWDKASLFGVPYWLPLIWGYGFVIIHRLGDLILQWVH